VLCDKNRINPICENCVVGHLKVLCNKNRINPICENCVVGHLKVWYNKIGLILSVKIVHNNRTAYQ
jgi:hypothetical protein